MLTLIATAALSLAAPTADKHPVPAEAEQSTARAAVRQAHAGEYEEAEGSASRSRALARTLRERSNAALEEPLYLYAYLVEAHAQAVIGEDPAEAFAAIAALATHFEPFDARALRIETLVTVGPAVQYGDRAEFARDQALTLAEGCLAAGDTANARRLVDAVSKKIKSLGKKDGTAERYKLLLPRLEEIESYEAAVAKLEEEPDDAEANAVVGRYLVFVLGDFTGGVPHLAAGPDGDGLVQCAVADLAGGKADARKKVEVGDLWFTWAKEHEGRERALALARAGHWYAAAEPDLPLPEVLALKAKLEEVPADEIRVSTRPSRLGELPSKTEKAVRAGLDWLVAHQDEDGSWDSDGFSVGCPIEEPEDEDDEPEPSECEGPGESGNDVGVTGLATLALLAGGPEYAEEVELAVGWLADQEGDPEHPGLMTVRKTSTYLYDHAIATRALIEAQLAYPELELLDECEAAVAVILGSRNPYAAWRYELPPNGENDMSVTGWMVAALSAAEKLGLEHLESVSSGVLDVLDEHTDPTAGTVGYTQAGAVSAHIPGVNDQFPRDFGPMTASGLLCRLLLDEDPDAGLLKKQVKLLRASLPEATAGELGPDLYSWYVGTEAMHLVGKSDARTWNKALARALEAQQNDDRHAEGSWDPDGPWGHAGGRVYSTSLAVLALTRPIR